MEIFLSFANFLSDSGMAIVVFTKITPLRLVIVVILTHPVYMYV
jgi:hypothetical protein